MNTGIIVNVIEQLSSPIIGAWPLSVALRIGCGFSRHHGAMTVECQCESEDLRRCACVGGTNHC
jgi:hypothetical protein